MSRVPRTARALTEEQADAVRLARDFAAEFWVERQVAVGQVLADRPELAGVELNPLLARPGDSFALDLLATLRDP